MKRILIASFLGAALPAAALDTYTVDPGHTFPSFEIGHYGFSTQRGRFNKTSGKIGFDAAAKAGTADITIETASLSTGNERLEQRLRMPDFFDVEKHPTMTFKSSKFNFDGDKVKSVEGELTLKGNTKPVTFTASAFTCGPNPFNKRPMCGGEFTTTIKRTDFDMKYSVPAVTDEVLLRINVEATKD